MKHEFEDQHETGWQQLDAKNTHLHPCSHWNQRLASTVAVRRFSHTPCRDDGRDNRTNQCQSPPGLIGQDALRPVVWRIRRGWGNHCLRTTRIPLVARIVVGVWVVKLHCLGCATTGLGFLRGLGGETASEGTLVQPWGSTLIWAVKPNL